MLVTVEEFGQKIKSIAFDSEVLVHSYNNSVTEDENVV